MKVRLLIGLLLVAAGSGHALEVAKPPYPQRGELSGVVQVWGHPELAPLALRWQAAFRRLHPEVSFENRFDGSDVAMAGLYTGKADIALLGREARAPEAKAFEWIYRYAPPSVRVLTGSVDTPGRAPALLVCVHADNPAVDISPAQIDALFSFERKLGLAGSITTWGELGLGGAWKAKPVHLHTVDTESGTGRYFRAAALADSRQLNWGRIREHGGAQAGHPGSDRDSALALAALGRDRQGLAVVTGPVPAGIKVLAVRAPDGTGVLPTAGSVQARRYPFAREVRAYFNRRPGDAMDAPTASFLRFVLGAEGQGAVAEGDGYLPLSPQAATQEATALN